MTASTIGRIITVFAVGFMSAGVAYGQATTTSAWETAERNSAWESAERNIAAKEKVYVVTVGHPKRRIPCEVQSIDYGEIVCTHPGHTTAYQIGDVAALIEAGEHSYWYLYGAGFLPAAGAATWGTVVLAAICPPCAVATGVAAAFLFLMADGSGFLSDGDSSDALLYLAPGQRLQVRLD